MRAAAGEARLVGGLALGQLLGWGATFFMPAVLGAAQERDLGLPPGGSVPGITLMLVLSGLLAPRVGRAVQRRGARPFLVSGALLLSAGLALMASAGGWATLALAWLLLGLAAPLCLSEPTMAALVQAGPEEARRRITLLLLVTGLTPTLAWPLLAWLEAGWGWRGALGWAAAANLLCAPLYALCAPRGAPPPPARGAGASSGWTRPLRRLAWALSLGVLVSSGVSVALIGLLEGMGLSRAGAVALGALTGPLNVAARLLDLALGRRIGALRTAALALSVLTFAFAFPLLLAGEAAAWPFVVLYALGAGAMTVLRPACVLALSDPALYAAVQGRVMGWVTIAMAVSPSVFVALLWTGGPSLALLACLLAGLAAVRMITLAGRG